MSETVITNEYVGSIRSISDYEQKAKSFGGSVVALNFWALWSTASQHMSEVFEELSKSKEYSNVQFLRVEAELMPELASRFSVKAVPTFVFIQNGNIIDRVEGANAVELTKKIRRYSTQSSPVESSQDPKAKLVARLTALVKSHACMVFMKGNPTEPRCGFSRQLIDILDQYNADYKTFDILSDEDVRQGLKEFSNWPTFPQLYVNGELIGGLDIIKELQSNGELKDVLPTKQSLEGKLQSLIKKSPVMVFMKGNRQEPRCGFSRTLVQILNDAGATYETFDILQDEEVRQGLKTYSNWPTYPQVYVKGQLIGGLDIVKELNETNGLKEALGID